MSKRFQVLEFKHHSPFDGCYWRYEYILLEYFPSDPKPTLYPLVFTENYLSEVDVVDLLVYEDYESPEESFYNEYMEKMQLRKYDTPTVYDWGPELFKEIPYNYFPEFARVNEEFKVDPPFTWQCDECGGESSEAPMFKSGYRGNGGIGIEVTGWLCASCHYERERE